MSVGSSQEPLVKIYAVQSVPGHEIASLMTNNFIHKTPICISDTQPTLDDALFMLGTTKHDKYIGIIFTSHF